MDTINEAIPIPKWLMNLQNKEAPFTVISFGHYLIQLFYTGGGRDEPQVMTVLYNQDGLCYHSKTTGFGYCKVSESTQKVWDFIGLCPRSHYPNSQIEDKYFVGGNYYKVPDTDIVETSKG